MDKRENRELRDKCGQVPYEAENGVIAERACGCSFYLRYEQVKHVYMLW